MEEEEKADDNDEEEEEDDEEEEVGVDGSIRRCFEAIGGELGMLLSSNVLSFLLPLLPFSLLSLFALPNSAC